MWPRTRLSTPAHHLQDSSTLDRLGKGSLAKEVAIHAVKDTNSNHQERMMLRIPLFQSPSRSCNDIGK